METTAVDLVVEFAQLLAVLPVWLQWLVFVALLCWMLLPHIAPFTPWTWDDQFIGRQPVPRALLFRLWNMLTANYGRAANRGADDELDPRG